MKGLPLAGLCASLLILISQRVHAQFRYQVDSLFFAHSVIVGDTALIAQYSAFVSSYCDNCTATWQRVESQSGQFSADFIGSDVKVYFHPTVIGPDTGHLVGNAWCPGNRSCPGFWQTLQGFVPATAMSDSFVKIRPSVWTITMRPDSLIPGQFIGLSKLSFDNPISDTTIFSDFFASFYNTACTLQVVDSSLLITEYRAHPFARKHMLTFSFLSQPDRSLSSLALSVRIRHGNVDTVMWFYPSVHWDLPSVVSDPTKEPSGACLPNPFTSKTRISLQISERKLLTLKLLEGTGRIVRTIERECNGGQNEIEIDGSTLPPGAYWYVVRAGEWAQGGKLMKIEP